MMDDRRNGESGPGRVWLVGAGPGDPGLLTLRGREVLMRAQVVVCDRLIGAGLCAYFPADAVLIDVGKNAGSHPVTQRGIEEILVREALKGQRVVRLKGGDPLLFGRGGEEYDALRAHGIACEIVPGVTSALSVPAYAGVPVTQRGVSPGVTIVTAHRAEGQEGLDYANLAASKQTLIFLMGAGRLAEIASLLIESGRSAETPVAVVENGTTSRQRNLYATLGTVAARAAAEEIGAPAILAVGEVAGLYDRLDWRARQPLAGRRVWLTMQAGPLAGALAARLRDDGAEVVESPCIATQPLEARLPSFDAFDWIAFTSRTGVISFFRALRQNRVDVRGLGKIKVAAIGPATAAEAAERGLLVDFVPEVYDGAHLAAGLAQRGAARVLLPRPEVALPQWAQSAPGMPVFEGLAVYRTTCATLPASVRPCADEVVVFASSSAVRVFSSRFGEADGKPKAVCIGTPTTSAAQSAGYDAITASAATEDALFDAAVRACEAVRTEGIA